MIPKASKSTHIRRFIVSRASLRLRRGKDLLRRHIPREELANTSTPKMLRRELESRRHPWRSCGSPSVGKALRWEREYTAAWYTEGAEPITKMIKKTSKIIKNIKNHQKRQKSSKKTKIIKNVKNHQKNIKNHQKRQKSSKKTSSCRTRQNIILRKWF